MFSLLRIAGTLGAIGERRDVERAWDDFRRTVSAASPVAVAAAMLGLLVGLLSLARPPKSP